MTKVFSGGFITIQVYNNDRPLFRCHYLCNYCAQVTQLPTFQQSWLATCTEYYTSFRTEFQLLGVIPQRAQHSLYGSLRCYNSTALLILRVFGWTISWYIVFNKQTSMRFYEPNNISFCLDIFEPPADETTSPKGRLWQRSTMRSSLKATNKREDLTHRYVDVNLSLMHINAKKNIN